MDSRPFADFSINADVAAGLVYETVYLTEAEAGALSDRLGREERFEYLSQDLLAHPTSGISYGHANEGHARVWHVLDIVRPVRCFDRQRPAAVHGVPCIDREIEYRHVELVRVDLNPPQMCRATEGKAAAVRDYLDHMALGGFA